LEQLTHYNYQIAYHPGDKNCAADALSQRNKLKLDTPDEEKPAALFDPAHFIKVSKICTDGQTIEAISDITQNVDPTEWPTNHELNDKLVLVSKDTGRIWVPNVEEIK